MNYKTMFITLDEAKLLKLINKGRCDLCCFTSGESCNKRKLTGTRCHTHSNGHLVEFKDNEVGIYWIENG